MSASHAAFAVFGSTPLAQLVAGLLQHAHGHQTILVGESHARYRLPREVDLSVATLTRPSTWALLSDLIPETTRLLAKIAGRGSWEHVDPVFFAETISAQEALGHIHNMAAAFGLSVETVPLSLMASGRSGIRIRDCIRLVRPVIEPALDRWLDELGVARIAPEHVSVAEDGAANITSGGKDYTAAQAVLADDAAVIAYLPLRQWPTLLARRAMSSIQTTPTAPLVASVMAHVDTGTMLVQHDRGGIAAMGPGDFASAATRLSSLLNGARSIQQAGQIGYQSLITQDGAPAVGRVAGAGADIVVGMGTTGAFIAPALARWLAGVASAQEAAWFGDRLVGRDSALASVAEYLPNFGTST